jgi:hypothetical protein
MFTAGGLIGAPLFVFRAKGGPTLPITESARSTLYTDRSYPRETVIVQLLCSAVVAFSLTDSYIFRLFASL